MLRGEEFSVVCILTVTQLKIILVVPGAEDCAHQAPAQIRRRRFLDHALIPAPPYLRLRGPLARSRPPAICLPEDKDNLGAGDSTTASTVEPSAIQNLYFISRCINRDGDCRARFKISINNWSRVGII